MSRVKVEITERAFYDLKKVDILKGRVCSIGHTYNMETDERKDFHIDVEIAAMEKQPEYEFVKVSLEQVVEDIMVKGIDSYYFIAPDGKEYKVVTLSIEQLKLHKDSLYQYVEITPEQKREREVEELAKKMYHDFEVSEGNENHPEWGNIMGAHRRMYKSNAKAALEWMESKK